MTDVRAEAAEQDAIRLQVAILDSVGQAVVATDVGGTVIYWNKAAEALYGWTALEAVGRSVLELTPASQSLEEATRIFAELAAGRTWTGEFAVARRDGTTFPAHVTDTPVFGADGTLRAIVGISTDITEQKRAKQAVRHLSAIVESSSDAIIGRDLDGVIVSWNRGAEKLYGYLAADVIGRHSEFLAPDPADDEASDDLLRQVALGRQVEGLATARRHQDGGLVDVWLSVSPVYDDQGSLTGYSTIARDDSARKGVEQALTHAVLHDALTGLPNRLLLEDRLRQVQARAHHPDVHVCVMFLDVDDFKVINDRHGHLAGDEVLVEIAQRLRKAVRPDDTVARFGGDEFVVICEVRTVQAALDVGHRLLAALGAPFEPRRRDISGEVRVGASIGLVIAAPDAAPEALLRDADTAMYAAKARGRGHLELFDATMRGSAAHHRDHHPLS